MDYSKLTQLEILRIHKAAVEITNIVENEAIQTIKEILDKPNKN